MTTEPINEQGIEKTFSPIPEFGRWQDVQRLFGIKRGTLYNLISEGKVKSVCMRRKGNIHGCRLIYLQSVRDYLHSLLEAEQAVQPAK